jgi:hypothetical protein
MAQIIREISVDVAQLNRFSAIVAKQYDKSSRFLKVHLLNQEEPISIERGSTVVINARREDDVAKSFAGEVNDDGTVTVPLTYWMLELDGTVKCDISIITGEDTMLTTTLFELQVEEAAADDESISNDDDYGILIELINSVKQESIALTNQYETSAKNLRSQYESSAQSMKNTYEASMTQAVKDCEDAVAATQLVTEPFFIVDNDNHKQYTAAIQVTGGKPILVYEELTS